MNCIIVDRNAANHKQMNEYISQDPMLKLKANCYTAFEALDVLQNQSIDLIFIDTELSPISGISFVKNLFTRPLIIFTSPDGQLAAEAFNLDAADYLIKPVSFERFFKSVQKAHELFSLKKLKMERLRVDEPGNETQQEYILVKSDYTTIKINLEDILYVEGLKDYIKIHTTDNKKPIITLNSLKNIQQALPADRFSRIHKSYIVSLKHITSINKAQVIIAGNYIPIGESYRTYFFSKLNKRMI